MAFIVRAGSFGNQRFGGLVKDLREQSGFTPKELAELVGVHPSFIRGIERGVQAPSVETARKILDAFPFPSRITWLNSRINDVKIYDRNLEMAVAFKFKAEVKGQNKRPDKKENVRVFAPLYNVHDQQSFVIYKDPADDTWLVYSEVRSPSTAAAIAAAMNAQEVSDNDEQGEGPDGINPGGSDSADLERDPDAP